MDEVYRDYRIAIKATVDGWLARITAVGGTVTPISARATLAEGEDICAARARQTIDAFLAFLDERGERPPRP